MPQAIHQEVKSVQMCRDITEKIPIPLSRVHRFYCTKMGPRRRSRGPGYLPSITCKTYALLKLKPRLGP